MTTATAFWDGVAAGYAKRPIAEPDIYEHTMSRTLSRLGPQDRVLELGCGTGGTALRLAKKAAHVTASDVSPAMLTFGEAKRGDAAVDFVAADLFDAALDGDYDVVAAFNLLHLIEDRAAALRRVRTLLPEGGLFISKTPCTPHHWWSFKYLMIVFAIPVMQMLGKAPFVDLTSTESLEAAVRDAGFEILEGEDHNASPPSRFIVARAI
ncbi:MAG: class I SAM-dependent methyltransferase [Pseudomonadota bacterium]